MTVSLKNSQDYKDFTLERLYEILETYELEMEQDELLEKGRKKGGSVALVAENERKEEMKAEIVKVAPSLNVGEGESVCPKSNHV